VLTDLIKNNIVFFLVKAKLMFKKAHLSLPVGLNWSGVVKKYFNLNHKI